MVQISGLRRCDDKARGCLITILSNTDLSLYRVMQYEMSLFWELIVSGIVKETVRMNMCVVLNGYVYRWMDEY